MIIHCVCILVKIANYPLVYSIELTVVILEACNFAKSGPETVYLVYVFSLMVINFGWLYSVLCHLPVL